MFEILCLCLLLLSFVFVVSLIQKFNEPIVFTNTAVQKAIQDISTNMDNTITDISNNLNTILNQL
mgnify:CR=1 FL=1|tara:strand:+ start:499 stop:693 length:195 start_codon:yes stop_codon:yes gene_type:complete